MDKAMKELQKLKGIGEVLARRLIGLAMTRLPRLLLRKSTG